MASKSPISSERSRAATALYAALFPVRSEKAPGAALCTDEENPAGDISPSSWNWRISFAVTPISPQRDANTTGTSPSGLTRHATAIAARSTSVSRRRARDGTNETSGFGVSSVAFHTA